METSPLRHQPWFLFLVHFVLLFDGIVAVLVLPVALRLLRRFPFAHLITTFPLNCRDLDYFGKFLDLAVVICDFLLLITDFEHRTWYLLCNSQWELLSVARVRARGLVCRSLLLVHMPCLAKVINFLHEVWRNKSLLMGFCESYQPS